MFITRWQRLFHNSTKLYQRCTSQQKVLSSTSKKMSAESHPNKLTFAPQNFDYFLVLDFEATCDKDKQIKPQEIIEFPVLKVSGKTFNTEAVFHQYVQPQIHQQLTAFCTQLTGIIQDMVDDKPYLEETLQLFHQWMLQNDLLKEDVKTAFVTCGDWDLKHMLPGQCSHFNIALPRYMRRWINIKRSFSDVTGKFPRGMLSMLQSLNLQHEGRHHSGIDDSKNIANILKALAARGHTFYLTGESQR